LVEVLPMLVESNSGEAGEEQGHAHGGTVPVNSPSALVAHVGRISVA
jgi:hypothetical protein